MAPLRLRIAHMPRLPTFPDDDEVIGAELWRELTSRLQKGAPRPTLFVFSGEQVQIVDLAPFLTGQTDLHRAISSFAALPDTVALAASGVMTRRNRGRDIGKFAVGFVEWSDGRWWSCTRSTESQGIPVGDAEDEINRAVDGAAKPAGLGGWFSRARFENLTISLKRHDEAGDAN